MQFFKIKFNKLLVLAMAVLFLLPTFTLSIIASEKSLSEIELYPGGMAFGVKISSPGLSIVKFTSTKGPDPSPAYLAGLREGDIIIKVNDETTENISQMVKKIESLENKNTSLEEAVVNYTKGLELSKKCYEILNQNEELVVKKMTDAGLVEFNRE